VRFVWYGTFLPAVEILVPEEHVESINGPQSTYQITSQPNYFLILKRTCPLIPESKLLNNAAPTVEPEEIAFSVEGQPSSTPRDHEPAPVYHLMVNLPSSVDEGRVPFLIDGQKVSVVGNCSDRLTFVFDPPFRLAIELGDTLSIPIPKLIGRDDPYVILLCQRISRDHHSLSVVTRNILPECFH